MLTWLKHQRDLLLDLKVCIHVDIFIGTLSYYVACVVYMLWVSLSLSLPLSLFEDSSFTWANAGATVFGAGVAPARKTKSNEEAGDDEEATDNVDIHFEPIVSLPEVPFKE